MLAVAMGLLATVPAQGGKNARLAGSFDVTATIISSNIPGHPAGAKFERVWSFKPTCPKGACRKVTLKRTGGDGHVFKSTLKRAGKGKYKGTETSRVKCIAMAGSRGTQTVKHTVEIVKAKKGKAKKVKGKAVFSTPECGSTEKVSWVAKKG